MGYAGISLIFSHIYTITIIVISLALFEVILKIRSVFMCISSHKNSPRLAATTAHFLASLDQDLPTTQFENGSMVKTQSVECPVCLCNFKEGDMMRELHCKHAFHKDCIDRWLENEGATCPMCRSFMLLKGAAIQQWRWEDDYFFEEKISSWFLSWNRSSELHRLVWAR